MKRLLAVMRRDFDHVRHNVIALLVCMGLAIMPSLYAWFNIAGNWDPYGNTDQVKVAVASSDEGYSGNLLPINVNVGDRVIAALAQSDALDFVVTQEDDALEGVRSGAYYAAVVMPKNFSTDLMSALSKDATHPQLDYYVNEKRNAIASIVTGKASDAVQTKVDEGFAQAVTQVGAELLEEFSNTMDDDTLLSVASSLKDALNNSARSVRQTADDMEAYKAAISSLKATMTTASSLLSNNTSSIEASSLLSTAADGVSQFDDAAKEAESLASDAIDQGLASVGTLEDQIDNAFDVADGQADRLAQALEKVSSEVHDRQSALQRFVDSLDALTGNAEELVRVMEADSAYASVDVEYAHGVRTDISDLKGRVQNALAYVNELVGSYDKLVSDLASSRGDAESSRQELKGLVANVRKGIEDVRTDYENNLSGSLGGLASTINDAAADASNASSALNGTSDELAPVVKDTAADLTKLEDSLTDASSKLNKAAKTIDDLRSKLAKATSAGNFDAIRTIVGTDPTGLAEFVSSPVSLDRVALFPVDNTGSAIAPYYTTMALWVGGTLMGILLYVGISDEARKQTQAKPRHAYFGRLAFFLILGAFQSTILLLGDIYFLGIQCNNPLLFLLTGWLASAVFINIIFSLATSLGDIGKAIAVLLMVVQVAGSGGTFPVQMLPAPFRALYPFLPFVHSENAMRAAMFGTYGNDWLVSMGILAAYLVPALLLGLLLRKPLVRANEWIERKLEETQIM